MRISSTDNPIYRRLKQLATSAKACREARRTLIEGVHLLQAALDAQVTIHTIVLRGAETSNEALEVARAAEAQSKAKLIELAPSLYDTTSPVERGVGVLAEIEFEIPPWPERIVEDAVYLDNVQDPGNVGTLLRTAAAAGIRHAITGPACAFMWSSKVMRAAMGAQFVLNLHEQITPQQVRDAFAGEILAAEAIGGEQIFEANWGGSPTVWMFGGEGQGLSAEALAISDRQLSVPINARVDSLNVSAAAAVCLFEQIRRRHEVAQAPALTS